MINFDYNKPSSVTAAIAALSKDPAAKFIAGGSNLVDLMKRGVVNPLKLVDITGLPLRQIEQKGNVLSIGALALNSEVAENPLVKKHVPLLSQALQAGASPQIRNMATVGGNLLQRTRCGYFYDTALPCNKREPGTGCSALKGYNRMHAIFGASDTCIAVHPSDMCIALAALDAVVVVQSNKGTRKIAFHDFHRLPGAHPELDNTLQKNELIIAVEVPLNAGFAQHSVYTKIRDRASYAFALVSVAAAIELDGNTISACKLAMGGVAHKPWRLMEAEKFLAGKVASLSNFTEAAARAVAGAKGFGHNDFKIKLATNTIIHTLESATRS